jgi:hypothetical protein
LFVCGLFGGQGMAQTASTDPVGKLIQLLHPGESETKPPERSAAKHSSKAHPAAKKRASAKTASKENASNGAPQVTANERVTDGETVRVASPDDTNGIDPANTHGAPATDASSTAATIVTAASIETIAPANSEAVAVSQTSSSSIEGISWLLRVITTLSGAVAIGSITWFLIAPSAPGWTKRTFRQ